MLLSSEEIEFLKNCERQQSIAEKKSINDMTQNLTIMEESARLDAKIEKRRLQLLKDKSCLGLSDKELLILAAKASGLKICKSPYVKSWCGNDGFDINGNLVLDWHAHNWHQHNAWNPLRNSSDAFLLAAKLKLNVEFEDTALETSRRIVIAAAQIEIAKKEKLKGINMITDEELEHLRALISEISYRKHLVKISTNEAWNKNERILIEKWTEGLCDKLLLLGLMIKHRRCEIKEDKNND